jgi:uncharacterized protein YjbI with pentapeptide repeats
MAALAVVLSTSATAGAAGLKTATAPPAVKRTHAVASLHVTLLFVTSAASGTIAPVTGSSSTYSLTLQGLDRNVVWFSDHPARKAGTVPAGAFVQDWSGYGFTSDPPNVALVLDAAHPGHDTAVGSLSSPSFDPGTDTLRADFTVFAGQRLSHVTGDLADKAQRAVGATLPATFGGASLFIDDAWQPLLNANQFPGTVTTNVAETLIGHGPQTFSSPTPGEPYAVAYGAVEGSLAGSTFVGPLLFTTPSLSGVNLSDVTESGVGTLQFDVIDFTDTDLQGADLPNATFPLAGVDFDGADLQGATLGQVNGAITDADTTCTNGLPGPCTGPGLTSG